MIPREYVQEVVARNDIEPLIGEYVKLRRRGRTATGLCPFHNEKTPSFVVYPETQSYYCFGCGAAGDAITFVRQYHNLGYVEAVRQLAARAGMPMPEEQDGESAARQRLLEINRCAARYFFEQLNAQTPAAAAARAYWRQKRGLSDAAIRRFGLGYAPEEFTGLLHALKHRGFTEAELETSGLVKRSSKGNLYDIFRHRVMVPIIDVRGNIIAFGGRVLDDTKPKYINSPETAVYKKSRTLFALNVAKKAPSKRYILCEGYLDVISLHEAGFGTAVCACGTALTSEQVKLLSEYAEEVVLCYDSDEAGQKATERSLALFAQSPLKVTVLTLPGAKDPDEFLRSYGKDRFTQLLEGSANPVEFALEKAKKKYDLRSDSGRLEYIREAVAVLAGQEVTPTARDVYAGRVAQQTGVDKKAVAAQIESARRAGGRARRRQEQRGLASQGVAADIRVPYTSGGTEAVGAAYAGRQLAAALLQDPAQIPYVRANLDPETLLLPEIRQGIEAIFACADAGEPVNLTALGTRLEEKAFRQMALALAQNDGHPLQRADIDLFLQRLRGAKPESGRAAGTSDEEFRRLMDGIASRKGGGADP